MCHVARSVAVAACVLASTSLHAEPLRPIQAQNVDFGGLTGVGYYTVEPDGYRLVLTLRAPQSAAPFRVVATLAPAQTLTLSVPRKAGEPAAELHFVRHDERLFVEGEGGRAAVHDEAHSE
jgi:hypothetical protein